MKYTKPPFTIAQQVRRLQDRGMLGDAELMAERLAVVSYYRLTAYWHPFRRPDRSFKPGTRFDTVWDRYVFDRHLRLITLDAIERIEIAVRSQLALHHALAHNAFAYAEQPHSLPRLQFRQRQRFQNELTVAYKRSEEVFVEQFKRDHGSDHQHLPVWMATEIMSFGCMLTFYRGCHADIQRPIAQTFGVHHSVLESWLLTLNVVRNICAHHSRFWNRVLGVKPKIPRNDPRWHNPAAVPNDRVFAILTLCKHALDRIASQSHWPARVLDLLRRFPELPRDEMGFPENWLDCPIWSSLKQEGQS